MLTSLEGEVEIWRIVLSICRRKERRRPSVLDMQNSDPDYCPSQLAMLLLF